VYKRSLDGNASADNASAALRGAKEAARKGRELLDKYKAEYGRCSDIFLSIHSELQAKAKAAETAAKDHVMAAKDRAGAGVSAGGHRGGDSSSVSLADIVTGHQYPVLVQRLVTPRARNMLKTLADFFYSRVLPMEEAVLRAGYEPHAAGAQWQVHPAVEVLKAEARALGLWNLFLPGEQKPCCAALCCAVRRPEELNSRCAVETDKGKYGAGLTNLEVNSPNALPVCAIMCLILAPRRPVCHHGRAHRAVAHRCRGLQLQRPGHRQHGGEVPSALINDVRSLVACLAGAREVRHGCAEESLLGAAAERNHPVVLCHDGRPAIASIPRLPLHVPMISFSGARRRFLRRDEHGGHCAARRGGCAFIARGSHQMRRRHAV
jgi:hypothetical protein